MPMSRYEIRNEYSLADPEIYGAADKDDPEALLEAVAMAGLVGVLRQLGDLAEFAAEVFHDLHEEVMVTATRGHGLTVRVKQLEAEFPVIEKAFLSQTSPSPFYSNPGTCWHPSPQTNQNLITGGDLPRFIMDSYEECRGPPRLFLLDKFDVAGAGACLKRYTDPSFFKVEVSSYGLSRAEVQKEKKYRKSKNKGSRLRIAGTPEALPASHAKLQQLFLEDRVENCVTDPARRVKLKRRLNRHPFDSKAGKSFMEKFISVSSPEDKVVHEIAYGSLPLEFSSKTTSESETAVSSLKESMSVDRTVLKPFVDRVSEDLRDGELSISIKQYPLEVVDEKEIAVDGESKTDGTEDSYRSDDVASEVDTYVDALATMESEIETDAEFRSKNDIGIVDMEKKAIDYDASEELLQVQSSDSRSTGNSNASEDENNSVKKGLSSFSYSDTGSTAAENMPVDVDVAAKVSTSTKVCEAEVAVMLTEKNSTSEELSVAQDFQPPKLDVSKDTSNEVTHITSSGSESEDPSSSLHHSDSFPTRAPLDEVYMLREAQMVKILSNHDELDTKFIKTEENSRTQGNNIPWISRHSSVPLQTKDDEPPVHTKPAENHILDKLDSDPSVLPSASINNSENVIEVIPKKYDDECSSDDLPEVVHEEAIFTEDLVDSEFGPPHSVNPNAEVKPSLPAYLDIETSNTVLQPDVLDSVHNVFPSTKAITVGSNFASDSSYNSSIAEQQGAEWANVDSPIPIVSAIDACHKEGTPTSLLREADSGVMGEIACRISLIGSEATEVEISSDHLYSGSPRSFTGFPVPSKADDVEVGDISSSVNSDEIEAAALAVSLGSGNTTGPGSLIDEKQTEAGQSENVMVAPVVTNHDSEAVAADDFHCVQTLDRYGSEVHDQILLQNYNESVKQTALVTHNIASPDLNSLRCEIDIGDHLDSEMVSHVPELSLQPVKTTALSSSSIYSVQNTVPVFSVGNNFHEHSGDALPSSTHHFPEVRTHSKPELTLQTDQFNIEHLHVNESKPKEVSQSELLSCSNQLDEGSSDAYSEPCFVASKSVIPVNLQADNLAVESLYGDKSSFGLSSNLDLNHTDHGGNFITFPRPSSVPPMLELSQPGSHEVDISAVARDDVGAVGSGFPPLPEVPQVDLAEKPPMPPLPPVQWRIGKSQQRASLASDRDSAQNSFGLFPPKSSNSTQMGYPTDRDDLLPAVRILPPPAAEDADHQHNYEHLLGTEAHSGPLSMQMPLTSNNRSGEFPTSDKTSDTGTCLTLPSTVNESPGQSMHAGEAESMLSKNTPSSPVTTSVDASYLSGFVPSHPLSGLQPKLCLESESTSARSEVRLIKFSDTNLSQPRVADEHPTDVCATSEDESVTSTSKSLYPAPEDGTLNGNRHIKLPRPRSPLIDDLATHDKSTLKKMTKLSRPEVQKVEERENLLEQIRAQSVNLKPPVVTRPKNPDPTPNLTVAAMLEKAKAIRQASAGSDDEEDNWND